jgi:DNA-binding CsgD family transcriptional regulator
LPASKPILVNPGYESLTPREQEVMAMLAEGMNAVQVAEKLFISPKTAENHRANIMRKLGSAQLNRTCSLCCKDWSN